MKLKRSRKQIVHHNKSDVLSTTLHQHDIMSANKNNQNMKHKNQCSDRIILVNSVHLATHNHKQVTQSGIYYKHLNQYMNHRFCPHFSHSYSSLTFMQYVDGKKLLASAVQRNSSLRELESYLPIISPCVCVCLSQVSVLSKRLDRAGGMEASFNLTHCVI